MKFVLFADPSSGTAIDLAVIISLFSRLLLLMKTKRAGHLKSTQSSAGVRLAC